MITSSKSDAPNNSWTASRTISSFVRDKPSILTLSTLAFKIHNKTRLLVIEKQDLPKFLLNQILCFLCHSFHSQFRVLVSVSVQVPDFYRLDYN